MSLVVFRRPYFKQPLNLECQTEDVDVDYAAKLLVYVFDPREPSAARAWSM